MVCLQYVIIQNYRAKLFVSKSQYMDQYYWSQATIYVKVRVLFVSRMKCIYAISGASIVRLKYRTSIESYLRNHGASVVRLQYRTTNHNSWCSIVRLNYRTCIESYLRNQWYLYFSYQLFNLSCGMIHFKYANTVNGVSTVQDRAAYRSR